MDVKLQKRVQRYGWDRSAPDYERSWRAQLQPAQELLLEMAVLRSGESVLDVACGTGLVTLPAARAVGSMGSVLAADISAIMIELCQNAVASASLTNVTFARMEAEALKCDDEAFDAVLCALGLMYVTDFAGSVQELFRVTRSGGRAVAAVWGQRDRCGWAGIFPIVDHRVNTDVCPLFFQLGTGKTLQMLFEKAGFTEVKTQRIQTTLSYANAEEACLAAFAGGPVAMAYSRFDDSTRTEAHAEYVESIAAYERQGGYDIPGEFVVVAGQR